jgi:hypothetical protein
MQEPKLVYIIVSRAEKKKYSLISEGMSGQFPSLKSYILYTSHRLGEKWLKLVDQFYNIGFFPAIVYIATKMAISFFF